MSGWKDHFPGAHERDIFVSIDKYTEKKKYYSTQEENEVIRKINHRSYEWECLGVAAPCVALLFPKFRATVIAKPSRVLPLSLVSFWGGWANLVCSRVKSMERLMEQDDMVIAYCAYVVMTTPKYDHMRDKFEYKYKLADFRMRYENFSLTGAMEPRLHANWDPINKSHTSYYQKILEARQKKYEVTGIVDFSIGQDWSRDITKDVDFELEQIPEYEPSNKLYSYIGSGNN